MYLKRSNICHRLRLTGWKDTFRQIRVDRSLNRQENLSRALKNHFLETLIKGYTFLDYLASVIAHCIIKRPVVEDAEGEHSAIVPDRFEGFIHAHYLVSHNN